MNNNTDNIEYDTHENQSSISRNGNWIAKLNHASDVSEFNEDDFDLSEDEKDDLYFDMIKDREEHLEQVN